MIRLELSENKFETKRINLLYGKATPCPYGLCRNSKTRSVLIPFVDVSLIPTSNNNFCNLRAE
jgi:hypothetical protein